MNNMNMNTQQYDKRRREYATAMASAQYERAAQIAAELARWASNSSRPATAAYWLVRAQLADRRVGRV